MIADQATDQTTDIPRNVRAALLQMGISKNELSCFDASSLLVQDIGIKDDVFDAFYGVLSDIYGIDLKKDEQYAPPEYSWMRYWDGFFSLIPVKRLVESRPLSLADLDRVMSAKRGHRMETGILLKKAGKALAAENYEEAYLTYLRLGIIMDGSMEAGSYAEMAAICLQKLGRNDEAIIWLERANMEQPNFPPYEEALEKAKRGEMIRRQSER